MELRSLIFTCLLLSSSCVRNTDANLAENTNIHTVNNQETSKSCPSISSETAVLIVKGRMYLDYDLDNREMRIEDDDVAWKITLYQIKNRHTQGGDPSVWVSKSDGRFLRVEHAK